MLIVTLIVKEFVVKEKGKMDRGEQRSKKKDKKKRKKLFPYKHGGKYRSLDLGK